MRFFINIDVNLCFLMQHNSYFPVIKIELKMELL